MSGIPTNSIDYRKDDKLTKEFFATVQNKMHYAVHGHTAAEIIINRAATADLRYIPFSTCKKQGVEV